MAAIVYETFGCKDAALVTPTTGGGTEADIYGIESVELSIEAESEQNYGDDAILSIWNHSQSGSLKFTTTYLNPDIYAAITGDTVDEDGSGTNQVDAVAFGTQNILTAESVCLKFTVTAKSSAGTSKEAIVYVYAARPISISPEGIEGKSLGKWVWTFELLQSALDESLAAVSPVAMGRFEIGPTSA